MWLERIKTDGYRNLNFGVLELEKGINYFSGQNGQGKTNLLEAVYYLITTKSFRTHFINECRTYDEDRCLVEGTLKKENLKFHLEVKFDGKQTQRFINQVRVNPIDYVGVGGVIFFSDRSSQIVDGSPEDRRRFLDQTLSLLDPVYLRIWSQYRRKIQILKKLLHEKNVQSQVFASFKRSIFPLAMDLAKRRKDFLNDIHERAAGLYRELFSQSEIPFFRYVTKEADKSEDYENRFFQIIPKEILYRKLMMGPHLDDVQIYLDQHSAKRFCSAGQVRSIALALKLAVRQMYFEKFGLYPIFIMDDLDSELDSSRLNRVLEFVSDWGQTLISSAKCAKIACPCQFHGYEVKSGKFYPLGKING